MAYQLVFTDRLPLSVSDRKRFETLVIKMAVKYEFNPNWLMALMYFATNGQFETSYYSTTERVGVFQFSKSAAKTLKIIQEELAELNHFEQLMYLEKYIKSRQARGLIRSFSHLYVLLFLPLLFKRRFHRFIVYKKPSKEYELLEEYDFLKKGYFHVEEVAAVIEEFLPLADPNGNLLLVENLPYSSSKNEERITSWLVGIVVVFLMQKIYLRKPKY